MLNHMTTAWNAAVDVPHEMSMHAMLHVHDPFNTLSNFTLFDKLVRALCLQATSSITQVIQRIQNG